MDLSERIIKYIENHHPISYTSIVNVAASKGFSETEVLQALDKVGRNKSITTKTRGTEVWYDLIIVKPVETPTHVSWISKNYPWPDADWTECFPEIDLGHLFLRTLEERQAYQAAVKGMPMYMLNKKYGR